jgi:2-polyprenyl-3-methyl-5-hydroxy-6-metoxy-1,4-benzoquinol methylase
VNYEDQQEYLKRSQIWGAAFVAALIVVAGACLAIAGTPSRLVAVEFGLAMIALAISMFYAPDYLQLTVNPEKQARWEIKIRWRAIGAVLVLGLLFASNRRGLAWILVAVAWLTAANLVAQKVRPRRCCCAYFWFADFILLAVFFLLRLGDPLFGVALLAAAAHLSIVICEGRPLKWAVVVIASGGLLLLSAGRRPIADLKFSLAAPGLLLVSALGTARLVSRAQKRNAKNVQAAQRELVEFTGYSTDRIWELWSISNQELAKNWQIAGLDENDAERIAEWYRQNSELYIFAIAAYNLEYKRIRSNLEVLRFAQGSCLDYGAGNGELILELARRGHPATYFDVEGESMKFAKQRAQQCGLAVRFLHSKEDLINASRQRGFDTIYSLDVLEHLPDLPAELKFLSSLLNPGGLLVFDVPAGSTKSHPMHLNHRLDVRAFLKAEGLEEKRGLLQKLPFRKQEKYVFLRS